MIDITEFQQFGKKKEAIQPRKKEVWCYTRVSSKEQKDNYSLRTQKESAERFAIEKGFTIVNTFGGSYESGKDDFTRKEFVRLLDEVKKTKNKPYAILVYNMTRFSRSGGRSISILNELIVKYNVHLVEILSGYSTDNARGLNELNRRLLEAEGDNIRKLEISVPGMKAFLRDGNWLGRAPLGYDHTGPKTIDHNRYSRVQKIFINEDGRKLKQAWQWKLEGVQDIEIARRLNKLGLKIDSKRLSDMWRNPFYCGIMANRLMDGKVIEGNHEALISREMFLKVNEINNRRKKGYAINKLVEERPLTGDILCFQCGNKLTGYLVRKKGLHYYKCQKCKGITINAITKSLIPDRTGAHVLFIELLKSYQIKPEFIELVKIQLEKMVNLTNNSSKKEEALFKKRLTELERDRDGLEERFALGKINEDLYRKFSSKLESEIYEHKEKNQIPVIDTSNFKKGLNKTIDFIQNVSKYWICGSVDIKKRIQRLVFPSGFYINPYTRQYLTPEVNQLFYVTSEIPRVSEDLKKNSPLV